jgi:hypothetical protein
MIGASPSLAAAAAAAAAVVLAVATGSGCGSHDAAPPVDPQASAPGDGTPGPPPRPVTYTLFDVGRVGGGPEAYDMPAPGIACEGTILGTTAARTLSPRVIACAWTAASGWVHVDAPEPAPIVAPGSVNDAGDVVGVYGSTAAGFRLFLWRQDAAARTILLPAGAVSGSGATIDAEGRVFALYQPGRDDGGTSAFLWRRGGEPMPIPRHAVDGWPGLYLDAVPAFPFGRQITYRTGTRPTRIVVWNSSTGSTIVGPASPDDGDYVPGGGGPRGEVVGSIVRGVQTSDAFVWSPTTGYTFLPPPPGIGNAEAIGIDAAGRVFGRIHGWTETGDVERAVVWIDGRMHDLAALVDPETPVPGQGVLVRVGVPNAKGEVIATYVGGSDSNDDLGDRLVLLRPKPSP